MLLYFHSPDLMFSVVVCFILQTCHRDIHQFEPRKQPCEWSEVTGLNNTFLPRDRAPTGPRYGRSGLYVGLLALTCSCSSKLMLAVRFLLVSVAVISIAVGATLGIFCVFFIILIGFVIYWKRFVTFIAGKTTKLKSVCLRRNIKLSVVDLQVFPQRIAGHPDSFHEVRQRCELCKIR